jgi:hypothetical protein
LGKLTNCTLKADFYLHFSLIRFVQIWLFDVKKKKLKGSEKEVGWPAAYENVLFSSFSTR